jgi:C-terminal binding protein
MPTTILYAEGLYDDDAEERRILGPDAAIVMRRTKALAELPDADCAATDGLMIFRHRVGPADLARFPRLRAIVRMGVGYDVIDRAAAAARGILVCNVPDYGTTEVADHAMAMALTLRRGLLLHHDARRGPAAGWSAIDDPLVRRSTGQTFALLGLGRIAIAVALRARAFGFRVIFHDPYQPSGTELALGIDRADSLDALLAVADILSIHAPLTPQTRGMLDRRALSLLPRGAVVLNTARGPILDLDALADLLESGHLAGAGLDVLPTEPPDPAALPRLLAAYRADAPWTQGRVIITPHSAYHSPQAWQDIRIKSAETMRAALMTNSPQNVVPPDRG